MRINAGRDWAEKSYLRGGRRAFRGAESWCSAGLRIFVVFYVLAALALFVASYPH